LTRNSRVGVSDGRERPAPCARPQGGHISVSTPFGGLVDAPNVAAEDTIGPTATSEPPKRPVGRYIVGLAVIAIAAVVSTILTSAALTRQEKDAGVLQVVTQQIAASESLQNAGFEIEAIDALDGRLDAARRLEATLVRIRDNHNGLRFGSELLDLPVDHSEAFNNQILVDVEPRLNAMVLVARDVIEDGSSGASLSVGDADELAQVSEDIRQGMNRIATLLRSEARERVGGLWITQLILLSVMLLLIVLVALFLFRPAVRDVRKEWE